MPFVSDFLPCVAITNANVRINKYVMYPKVSSRIAYATYDITGESCRSKLLYVFTIESAIDSPNSINIANDKNS